MITIQNAIKANSPTLMIDEVKINLKLDCAMFVTLNPGYSGRFEVPMDLKALLRPISMVVPDSVYIAEILLCCSGFLDAQKLSKKIVSV